MIDIEFKYCDLMPWRGSRSKNFLVDLHNRKFVSSTKIDEYIGSLKSKGGILADAVGLGKTLESTLAILYYYWYKYFQ